MDKLTRDQALVNNIIAQREAAANQSANVAADLDMAKAEIETLRARVTELESVVAATSAPKE